MAGTHENGLRQRPHLGPGSSAISSSSSSPLPLPSTGLSGGPDRMRR